MRAFEFLKEAETPAPKKVGREFNHLEDLVFTEPKGGQRALEVLQSMSKSAKDVALKWDGNPTVYWGRDEDGTFRMVGKNNWGREEGKSSSAEELKQFIMSRGKGEDWREKFASDMADMWNIFEAATPDSFRGYVYGDILFHPGKNKEVGNGYITFTPNQTTYKVKATSPDGIKLGKAKVAVAAHKKFDYFGDKTGEPFEEAEVFSGNPNLAIYGQTYVSHQPAVNADNIKVIANLVNANQQKIDAMLTPVAGMGYLQDLIYSFVNSKAKAKALNDLNTPAFMDFVSGTPAKAKKVAAHMEQFPGVMDKMFQLVLEVMKAKNEIIAELDAAEGDIQQTTKGQAGGEGYVKVGDAVKLVPRDRWTPFRSD